MATLFRTMIVVALVCTVLFPLGWRYISKRYALAQEEIVWEIEAYKAKGPGTTIILKPGEEPIGYDRDAQVIYVKRKVKGGDAP